MHQHSPSGLMSLCGHVGHGENTVLKVHKMCCLTRLKNSKAADECGLVAEVLRCVPHDCLSLFPTKMHGILHKGDVPSS